MRYFLTSYVCVIFRHLDCKILNKQLFFNAIISHHTHYQEKCTLNMEKKKNLNKFSIPNESEQMHSCVVIGSANASTEQKQKHYKQADYDDRLLFKPFDMHKGKGTPVEISNQIPFCGVKKSDVDSLENV